MMAQLSNLNVKIAEHCNYKCIGCNVHSNIAKEEFYSLEQFEMDLKRVAELIDVKAFHLLGGEPLLNPEIYKYILIARRYLPDSQIDIITNGVLLSRMDENFFEYLIDNQINISISHYPEKRDVEQDAYDTQLTFDVCREIMDCTAHFILVKFIIILGHSA